MNSSSSPGLLPSLRSLFWNDALFSRAVKTAGIGLMVAVGFWWVNRPMPNMPPPSVDLTFEKTVEEIVPPIALGVMAVALILAAWRWRYVRMIFTEGAVVPGKVVKLKCDKWQTSANVDQSHGSKSETRYSYYITFSYTVKGEERTLTRKLPNSGFVFGIQEGGPVELMVHESRPNKPLIRPVYLRR